MLKYVNRLIACGYSPYKAYTTCCSFAKDFSITELDMFVQSFEHNMYEGKQCG